MILDIEIMEALKVRNRMAGLKWLHKNGFSTVGGISKAKSTYGEARFLVNYTQEGNQLMAMYDKDKKLTAIEVFDRGTNKRTTYNF